MQALIHLATDYFELRRGELLKTPGSKDTHVYFIQEGTVRIFIEEGDFEQNIRFGYSGDLVTALDSYISEGVSPLGIQAIKRCRIAKINKQDLVHFFEEQQNVSLWISICEDLLLQQLEREMDLLCHSASLRYERVLARSPRLFQEIPHRHIANYLRMSPETLSRLKKH